MPTQNPGGRSNADRPARSDVRRNVAALLDAARAVFASSGVSAPAKAITDAAGLGVGTLYRHFPRRSDLIVAVLENEIDDCLRATHELRERHDPTVALERSMSQFVEFVRTKQGLAEALHSDDPAYDQLPAKLLASLEPAVDDILDDARAAGSVSSDTSAHELLIAVALLCQSVPAEDPALNERMVRQYLRGLRPA